MSPLSGARVPAAGEITGSGGTTGLVIQLVTASTGTADPGQEIDAAETTEPQGDEGFTTSPRMYERDIWAWNNDTVARDINLQWGGPGAANRLTVTLQPKALPVLLVDGWLLARGLSVKAWCATTDVVFVKHQRRAA